MNTNRTQHNSTKRFERQGEILVAGLGRHLSDHGKGLMPAYPACDWSLSIKQPHHEQGDFAPT